MDQLPFWLHKPLKRFVQYWGVVFTSLLIGIVYIKLSNSVSPRIAFVFCFVAALAAAYCVWQRIAGLFDFKTEHGVVNVRPTLIAVEASQVQSLGFAGTLTFVVVTVAAGPAVAGSEARFRTVCFPPQYSDAKSANSVLEKTNAYTNS